MTDAYEEDVPEPSEQLDQIQSEDSLVDRGVDDLLDEGVIPPDRWSAGESYGNTAEEMAEGESLDQRLAQEVPDNNEVADDIDAIDEEFIDDGEVGDERAGRLVDPNEGSGEDIDSELFGDDVGIDGAGASAEEAAMHIVEER